MDGVVKKKKEMSTPINEYTNKNLLKGMTK
jgi:hypothetical protein